MLFSRTWYGFLIIAIFMLIEPSKARAQQESERAFLEAALTIRSIDRLSDQCKAGKGFTRQQAATIAAWEAEQNVSALRTQLRSLPAAVQKMIDQGSAKVATELLKQFNTATPCEPTVYTQVSL